MAKQLANINDTDLRRGDLIVVVGADSFSGVVVGWTVHGTVRVQTNKGLRYLNDGMAVLIRKVGQAPYPCQRKGKPGSKCRDSITHPYTAAGLAYIAMTD